LAPGATHLRLNKPLGLWIKKTSPIWKWWKCPGSPYAYEKLEDGGWRRWTKCARRYRREKFKLPVSVGAEDIPNNIIRVSVDKPSWGERITVTSAGEAQESNQQLNPDTLLGTLEQLPDEPYNTSRFRGMGRRLQRQLYLEKQELHVMEA
jgi:hypothetical protein